MKSHRLAKKDSLVIIAAISSLVITGPSISIYGYFDIPKAVYGQSNSNQTISNSTNLVNMQDIPLEKVCVGDIDVAYKVFGRGDPIILYSGSLNNMDDWDPSFLMQVS